MSHYKDYIRLETHCHTKPASLCSLLTPETLVDLYVSLGYDAIILTNHYSNFHFQQFGDKKEDIINGYLHDYRLTKEFGERRGLKVFLGAELAVKCNKLVKNDAGEERIGHFEVLLYGLHEKLLWDTFNLADNGQRAIYEMCCAENILCIQSHPFRKRHFCEPLDTNYLHGVEVFNPHYETNIESTLNFATKNRMLITGGRDTHYLDEPHLAGMLVPKEIDNQMDFRDYLKSGESLIFNEDGLLVQNGELLRKINY